MLRTAFRHISIALLFSGSAIFLFSCGSKPVEAEHDDEGLMTDYSEDLTISETENGRLRYVVKTPLSESYSLAREPYREFRRGVDVVTYRSDSVGGVDVTLTANYAIHYEKRRLWEAKGNVVIRKSDGREVYTQQLFWNEKSGRVWSNVDTRIVEEGGRGSYVVEGFESDDRFRELSFRKIKGRMLLNVEPTQQDDSVRRESARRDSVRKAMERQSRELPAGGDKKPVPKITVPSSLNASGALRKEDDKPQPPRSPEVKKIRKL